MAQKTRQTVTMKDVAKATGVSVMTVSRAMKDDTSVHAETRETIRRTAEEMGYVFDSTAANLRTQRSNFVAAIIPSINNANFAETVTGLTETVEGSGRQVLLGNSNYDAAREERLVEQLLRRRPEAIVLTGGLHTTRTRTRLAAAGIPVIQTWDLPKDPIGHVVGFSNAAAMELLVDHLAGRNRKRIAFLGGDIAEDSRGADRRRGFIAAMQARKLSPDRLIDGGPLPVSMQSGATAMAQLFNTWPDTDALICVSDLAAFGALTECMRRGVSVPDQIAIAGFGAYDIASISVPTLTTVNPQARNIGRQAGELILALLDQSIPATADTADTTRPICIKIPTHLTIGGTSP